jgi:integrase
VSTEKEKTKRPRGTGSIYQPEGSRFWWIQYRRNGKVYRQSTETTKLWKAEKILARKLAEIATGIFIEPAAEKTLVKELAESVLRDYRINGKRSLDDAETRWNKHLSPIFGEMRAANVANDHLTQYVEKRQTEGAANASINRELAFLKRAFSLGIQAAKINRRPHFPHLKENNIRKGFVEDSQYEALCQACSKVGLWLRAILEVGATYGWRSGELTNLRVKQVDIAGKTIRLEAGETKNDEAREVVMTNTVAALLEQCVTGKAPDDFVFTRDKGKPVADFRGAWTKVCEEAGVPELLVHDLRRTGVRNMIRAGIPERVAMTISGHKTRSVLDRYNIVSAQDLKMAARKIEEATQRKAEEAAQKREAEAVRHSSDTVEPETVQPIARGVLQ